MELEKLKARARFLAQPGFLYGLGNWVLLAAGFVSLGRGAWLAFVDVTSSVALLGAGAVLVFAGSIDRFESLKGLGLEAKTRELNKKLNEAEVIFAHLRELAATTYGNLIAQGAKAGRWGAAPSFDELHALVCESRIQMQALGASTEAQRKALAPWVRMLICDWIRVAAKPVFEAAQGRQRALREAAMHARNGNDPEVTQKEEAARAFEADYKRAQERLLLDTPAELLMSELSNFALAYGQIVPQSEVAQSMQDWKDELDHLIDEQALLDAPKWRRFLEPPAA